QFTRLAGGGDGDAEACRPLSLTHLAFYVAVSKYGVSPEARLSQPAPEEALCVLLHRPSPAYRPRMASTSTGYEPSSPDGGKSPATQTTAAPPVHGTPSAWTRPPHYSASAHPPRKGCGGA